MSEQTAVMPEQIVVPYSVPISEAFDRDLANLTRWLDAAQQQGIDADWNGTITRPRMPRWYDDAGASLYVDDRTIGVVLLHEQGSEPCWYGVFADGSHVWAERQVLPVVKVRCFDWAQASLRALLFEGGFTMLAEVLS